MTEEELFKIIQKEAEKLPKITPINGTHYFIEGAGIVPIKEFDEAMRQSMVKK